MTAFQKRNGFYGEGTYNPFERPSMPLASLALDGMLGTGNDNDSGEPVDVLKGAAIPTAWRCMNIIATIVASLTLEEIAKDGDAEVWTTLENLESGTAYEVKETIALRLAGWGNYYARKVFQGRKLIDLIPYPNQDISVVKVKGAKTFRIRQRDDDGEYLVGPDQKPVFKDITDGPDCPVFHIPGPGFDGLQGVSPILLASQTFGTSLAADRLAARFYSRGQQLGGVIKVKAPLANQSQAEAIKMAWRNSHSGTRNAGDVAVLDAETDFTPITIAPEALQFLQSRQWQATEVARMFGVPPHLIGELEKSTSWGTGIEQQNIGFVAYTIRGYTDRIEQRFMKEFGIRGRVLEFDLDRLLRGDTTERYAAYGSAIGWGWMTPDEARIKERMKPLGGIHNKTLVAQAMNGQITGQSLGGAQPPGQGQLSGPKANNPGAGPPQDDQQSKGNGKPT